MLACYHVHNDNASMLTCALRKYILLLLLVEVLLLYILYINITSNNNDNKISYQFYTFELDFNPPNS